MAAAGATKIAIAKATGVTDMTILSVSQGKTKTFMKLTKLQSVYDRWKSGTLDLSGKRGKKQVASSVAEQAPAGTAVSTGKTASVMKSKTANRPAQVVKRKRRVRPTKSEDVTVTAGFELPDVTEEMVAGVEEQIRRLQAEAKFMRDLIAIKKKYGM